MGPPSFLVHLNKKPEIRIFCKQLIIELGKTDLSEFFTQHLVPVDVSSIKISCSLALRLTRYKQKQHIVFFRIADMVVRKLGGPILRNRGIMDTTADCNTLIDVFG
jgi:hypothetical protein